MSDEVPSLDATQGDGSKDAPPKALPASSKPSATSIFTIPPPLKRVFDRFPLVIYAENERPLRAPKSRGSNTLYVFTTDDEARKGRPSFNPGCLKWQTYLKIAGVPFTTVSSTNHASPSGSLPFLLPASAATAPTAPTPVPSSKLKKWLASQSNAEKVVEPLDARSDAYTTLLDNGVRKAWLYQLYLNTLNFPLARRLYVEPCSTNIFVQITISQQLRRAAENELTKSLATNTIVEDDIMQQAADAFEALSTLLGSDEWFFGQATPSLFDASVFAYTHLILDSNLQWKDNQLEELLMGHGNLVQHRYRLLEMYY